MRPLIRSLLALLAAGFLFASSFAAASDERLEKLPEKHRKWLEEEAVYIIANVEREAFLNLETDEEREAFIETFWRRRDTNPSTLENEYREEHEKRIAHANEFLGRDTFRPGWRTDRGRFYILLGPPTDIQNFESQEGVYPTELWFYNNPELTRYGLPPFFYLLFWRRHGTGELQLYNPLIDGPQALITGYQTMSRDFREDVEKAYNKLYEISPELAQASISFRTDEGDVVQFQAPSFGTVSLLDQIDRAPLRGVDTSYAERFYVERGRVESDYLFSYVPSYAQAVVLPGPGNTHYLHWVIELDPQHLALVKDEDQGIYGTLFLISAEVVSRDDPNKILMELRKESFMKLTGSQAAGGVNSPFAYMGMSPVLPGSFDVRIILRNRACTSREESSCRKSYTVLESSIDVPEWDSDRPQLTPIILAYGIERPEGKAVYRPFHFGAMQVLPNPRNVYAIGDRLVVMADPRHAQAGSKLRLTVASAQSPSEILFEQSTDVGGFRVEPLVHEMLLEGYAGGHYRVTVDLLAPDGRPLDTKTAEFDVTPRTAVARPVLRGSWSLIDPEVPGLLDMSLGEQYRSLGDASKARERFEASVAANPRFGPSREALSRLLIESGEPDKAIELLEPLYQSVPDRHEILALLGEAYFQKGDYTRSAEILEKAIVLRRPEPRTLNMLASSQESLGNLERAVELLQQSLALQPDQTEVKERLDKLKKR